MSTEYRLENLGKEIIQIIKQHPGLTMAEVAEKTLNITYANFQKRLSKNNIKLAELAQILDFLNIEFEITLGDKQFSSQPSSPKNYEVELAHRERIMELQEKIILLQEELQDKYQKE
ncbi:MAG: hypothetical protein AAF655_12425 [Bacteroidota bacterium]